MFFKKKEKDEYKKITKEQLKTVERVQQINAEIKAAHKDFYEVSNLAIYKYYSNTHEYFCFNSEYEDVIRDYIREKIEKLQQEKENLLKGDE